LSKKTITTNSPEETKQFAQDFAKNLTMPVIITLTGNLGAGKTTFVQGMALGLGIKKLVNSPTFLLIKKYIVDKKNVYHIDLYRLNSEKDIEGTGLLDILKEKDSIVIIEWAEKMGSLLPDDRIDIQFEYLDEGRRKIILCKR